MAATGVAEGPPAVPPAAPRVQPISLPTPFRIGPVNAFYLPGAVPTLVDCGPNTPEALAALESASAAEGFPLEGLARIVITHSHVDHCGLAAELQRRSAARVQVHALGAPALADFERAWEARVELHLRAAQAATVPEPLTAAFAELMRARGRLGSSVPEAAIEPLAADAVLRAGDADWQVLHSPGHAPDHIALFHAASGTLIGGDLVMRHVPTALLLEPRRADGRPRQTLDDLRASWLRVGNLPVSKVFAGHGPEVRAHRVLIARRLAGVRGRLQAARDALQAGATTIWEVACALGPEPPAPDTLNLRLGETVALLDWLVAHRRAGRVLADGVLRYSVGPTGSYQA